jgi:hypothetical protein
MTTLPPHPPLELDDIDLATEERTIDLRANYRPEKPRWDQDLWRESIIQTARRPAPSAVPKRVLPRRKRGIGERIANTYRRLVGRPTI